MSDPQERFDVVRRKVLAFERRLKRDPIAALGIRYIEGKGFVSDKVRFESGPVYAEIEIGKTERAVEEQWKPVEYRSIDTIVKPLHLLSTPFAILISVQIEHGDPEYRLRLNWLVKSAPSASKLFLLDVENNEYYYPLASDLTGYVISGHPKSGVLAFEGWRKATNHVQLHFVEVRLGRKATGESFHFDARDDNLHTTIEYCLAQPSLSAQLAKQREQLSPEGCFGRAVILALLVIGSYVAWSVSC